MHTTERPIFTETAQEAQAVDELLKILAEELQLANRWNRPSLLIATYRSEYVRAYAEGKLESLLQARGDCVARFLVGKDRFDVPAELRRLAEYQEKVFFVSGLRHGGGKSGRNAYRALNVRREILVDEKIRAVFWLTEAEAHGLPRFAPDFWAFRHRVVALDDFHFQSLRSASRLAEHLIWHDGLPQQPATSLDKPPADLLEQVERKIAGGLDTNTLSQLYRAGYTALKIGRQDQALALFERGADLAARAGASDLQARMLSGAGIAHLTSSSYGAAVTVLRLATGVHPKDVILWNNLGLAYYFNGRAAEALQALDRAVALKSRHARSWRTLGSLYFDLGYLDEARLAYQRSVKYHAQDALAWHTLGVVFLELGNRQKALHAFRKARKIDPAYPVPEDV